MPFRIFCSGNDSFHLGYSRVPVLGDVYDIQAAMGYLTTAGTEGGCRQEDARSGEIGEVIEVAAVDRDDALTDQPGSRPG